MYYLVLSAFIGCLGILTKLPGIITGLPAIYAIYAMLGRQALAPQRLRPLLVAAISISIAVSGYYLWARHLSLTYPPYHFAGQHQFISIAKIGDWMRHSYFLPKFADQIVGWLWTWPLAILALMGLLLPPLKENKSRSGTKSAPWFWHWFGVALVVDYLVEAQHLVGDPNNMYLFIPFAAAMAGNAIVTMFRLIWRGGFESARVMAIISIIIIVGVFGRQQIKSRYNPSYASSYHLGVIVNKIADPSDLIISFGLNPCTIYYSKLRGWLFPPTEVWHTSAGWDYGAQDIEALKSLWKEGARWLVISNSNDGYRNANDLKSGRGGKLWSYIESNFELYNDSEDGMVFRLPAYPLLSGRRRPNVTRELYL